MKNNVRFRYSDLLVLSTHNITDDSERSLTYHPSRLMGLSDMLNAVNTY